MNNKCIIAIVLIVILLGGIAFFNMNRDLKKTSSIEATILSKNDNSITVIDENDATYTFNEINTTFDVGSKVVIEYTGLLEEGAKVVEIKLVEAKDIKEEEPKDDISPDWLDDGIFSDYYTLAYNKLKEMTMDEKISQLLLVRYPESDSEAIRIMKEYQFGGYVLFARDFKDKTEQEVKTMLENVQKNAKIPALTCQI